MAGPKCAVCGKAAPRQCNTCLTTSYCSTECEAVDSPLYKLLCEKLQPFLKTRPADLKPNRAEGDGGSSYIAAILLPEKSDTPELIWLKFTHSVEADHDTDEEEDSDADEDSDEDKDDYEIYEFMINEDIRPYMFHPTNTEHTRKGNKIKIFLGDMSLIDNSPPNMCIDTLTAGFRRTTPRAGNHVIVGYQKCPPAERNRNFYGEVFRDIDLKDLRHAFQVLKDDSMIYEVPKLPNPYAVQDAWVKGVIVSNSGDMHYIGKDKYRAVVVHPNMKLFENEEVDRSPIAHMMDIPLLVLRLPHDRDWAHHITPGINWDPCKNNESNWLMTDTNLKLYNSQGEWNDWGNAKYGWNWGQDYSVLVVRSDKKGLTCQQVEALTTWFGESEDDIVWKMAGMDMRLPSDVRKAFCIANLQSDKFENYFEKLKKEKLEKGDLAWTDAVPPRDDWTSKYSDPKVWQDFRDRMAADGIAVPVRNRSKTDDSNADFSKVENNKVEGKKAKEDKVNTIEAAIRTKSTDNVQKISDKQDDSTNALGQNSKKNKYAATVEDADDTDD